MSDHGARALVLAALALVVGGVLLWWLAGRTGGEQLLVLTAAQREVVASGLVARAPVDWLPLVGEQPYEPQDATFDVVATPHGAALHPRRGPRPSAARTTRAPSAWPAAPASG